MNHPSKSSLPPLSVAPLRERDIPAVAQLVLAQEHRHMVLDPRLRAVRAQGWVEALLAQHLQHGDEALVARDQRERVRGYARPALWELSRESTLHAFLTARNGIAGHLTLPDPGDEDAHLVTTTLLSALSHAWQRLESRGELIRWPSRDSWIAHALLEQGFLLDSVCALHQLGPPMFPARSIPPWLQVRYAHAEDEAALVRLSEEAMDFHEACVPFARRSHAALRGFRAKLARLWSGYSLQEGAPLVLVAERDGRVIAMVESSLLDVSSYDEPGFTRPGRYVCLEHLCVEESSRGQGIGRLLVQTVFSLFASRPWEGYLLWYHPDNPLAALFWSRLGFVPLWVNYQRLHSFL